MAWSQMNIQQQWDDASAELGSGFVLKAYDPGTTTAISIAIDKDGGSPQATVTANAEGKWEVSGNEILPFIDRLHKWAIFSNATDATANSNPFAGFYDNVPQSPVQADTAIDRATTDIMIADPTLSAGNRIKTDEHTATYGYEGGNLYLARAVTGGTDDDGSLIKSTGNTAIEFLALFPDGPNIHQWGAGTAVADNSTAAQAMYDYCNKIICKKIGTYSYQTSISITTPDTNTFDQGVYIEGAGMEDCVFQNEVSSAPLFDIDSSGSPNFIQNNVFKNFKMTRGGSATSQVGVKFNEAYMTTLEYVHIDGLSGHGVEVETAVGDLDASNMFTMRQVRIENCTGWGIKGDSDTGFNEFSFMHLENVFVQACGTDEYVNVTNITQANPGVVTAAGHPFSNADKIKLFAVGGMTEVNGVTYTVANATSSTFELSGINTSGYGAYTSGGETGPLEPGSGGMIWKGQILTMLQSAFTLSQNCAFFIKGGSGLPSNCTLTATTFENNYKREVFIRGLSNLQADNIQLYNNTSEAFVGFECDGADSVIREIKVNSAKVRANSNNPNYTAFKLSGANVNFDTCRVKNVVWDNFDYTNQQRFEGWYFDHVVDCSILEATSTTSLTLKTQTAKGLGDTTPLRLSGGVGGVPSSTGEWTSYHLAQLSISNSSLANSTRYYCYLYDNNGAAALELSTTVPAVEALSGYLTKTGDITRYYVGSALTDGSALFTTSGVGWLNPEITYNGSQSGVVVYTWLDSTADRRQTYATAPTSDTDGTIIGTQS